MKELLTGDDIFATVLLLRTADDRSVLLLEGEDDCDCLGPHVDAASARFMPCGGKSNLDRAITLVDQNNVDLVLAVRDSDWVGVLETPSESPNIVYTDLYDLDATILLRTDIGRRVALMFGERERVEHHCEDTGAASPAAIAADIAAEVGIVRLASERSDANLSLRDFPIQEIYDSVEATIRRDRLITIAITRSSACQYSNDDLRQLVEVERRSWWAPDRLSSGHDLAGAFAVLCRQVWGGSTVGAKFLLKAARLALSCAELQTLELYHAVEDWEHRTGGRIWHCRSVAA